MIIQKYGTTRTDDCTSWETDTGTASSTVNFILVSVSTGAEIEMDWQWEKRIREIEWLLNKLKSIIQIKKIKATHQKESKKKIQQLWYDQPLYHLRLSRAEWSGKNFCKV